MSLRFGSSMEMVCPHSEAKSFSWSFQGSLQHLQFHKMTFCWKYRKPIIWRTPDSLDSFNNVRLQNLRSVFRVAQLCITCQSHRTKMDLSPFKVKATDKENEIGSSSAAYECLNTTSHKEEERRRKIGLANKGKVPWNKGKKHSEETRVRIKQRTIEALRKPEVRKKMSEHPQPHSDETKEKIRSSVKRVWANRLRLKRSKEKYISSWLEHIAEAAKKGGKGQVQLDWDSYDRMKEEILFKQLELAAEKARAKEQAKLRAEKAAEARAEKIKRLAEKRKERKEKVRIAAKNGKETSGLKLKQRLTKIHKKKVKLAVKKNGVESAVSKWEKLDLDLVKKDRMVREYSLADQIQAAKSKRSLLYQHWPHT